MLDYYNREYLFFGCGKSGDYWNPTLMEARTERDQARGQDWIIWKLRFSWLWQQSKLSSRLDSDRHSWKRLSEGARSEEFQKLYRKHNYLILRFWRLMGPNFHTILLLTSVFFRRFDLYLIMGDIFFLTVVLLMLRVWQRKKDEHLNAELKNRGILIG